MGKRLWKWLKRLVIGFFALILIVIILLSSTFDFLIHYLRYSDVVNRARELTAETSETVFFAGDWDYDIAPGPSEVSNICARRHEDGSLFVRILVRDLHRLGKVGLVYTEKDYETDRDLERAIDMNNCGEWYSKGGFWGPWWAINNNLG